MAHSKRPARAEARAEQLGHQVVVVEHEARAAQLQRQRDEEQQVGRVAGLHDVERPLAVEPPGEPQRVPERRAVLAQVAGGPARRGLQRVAVDLDALDQGVGLGVALRCRAGR